MKQFTIQYFAYDTKHIALRENGEIEIENTNFVIRDSPSNLIMDYSQAKILKAMILAQAELEKL